MVELTEEQIGMLNLSPEKINDLATANPLQRKSTTNKMILINIIKIVIGAKCHISKTNRMNHRIFNAGV